jgi:HK97 family phage major capsid protein
MATIQELREQRAQLIADARKIVDAAGAEKRELTNEESGKSDEMLDKAEEIKTSIETREKAETRASRLEAAENELRAAGSRRGGNSAPVQHRPGDGPRNPEGHRREARELSADEVREISWRVANGERRVAIDPRRGSTEYRSAFERYLSSGSTTGLDAAGQGERRDLAADSDTDGGYIMAPTQMVANLLKFVDDAVAVRQFASVFQLRGSQNLGVPTLDTDVSDPDWTTEIQTGTRDTAMKFGKRELNPVPLAKRVLISRKLLRNAAMGVEAIVQQRLGYKFGITEEKAFLTGNGANQPLGMFTASTNGISTGRDVNSGSTTDFTADGLIDAKFSLKSQYLANARWMLHRDGLRRIRKLKGSDNNYLWTPGLAGGEPDRILDLPYTLSEFAPNTFTTGLYIAILGDFRFYWIAEALGLEVQRLNELYAEANQVGYIGRMEVDGMPVLEEAFVRVKTN